MRILDWFKAELTKEEKPIPKHKHYWVQYGGYYSDPFWLCKICKINSDEYLINKKEKK